MLDCRPKHSLVVFIVIVLILLISITPLQVNSDIVFKGVQRLRLRIYGYIFNNGTSPIPVNDTDLLIFDYPIRTLGQKVDGVKAWVDEKEYNYTLENDDGSVSLIINAPEIENATIEPGQEMEAGVEYNVTVNLTARILSAIGIISATNLTELISQSGSWSDIPSIDEKYVEKTVMWNYSNPLIRLLVKYIERQGRDKPLIAVLSAIKWLDDNIVYKTRIPPRHPWEVVLEGAGDCDDQSNLLITILRSMGVPSYLEVGMVWVNNSFNMTNTGANGHITYTFIGGGGHGWVVAYIPPWGWVRIDMTVSLGTGIDHIRYAAYYITPIVVTANVTKGDYATSSAHFTEEVEEKELYYRLYVEIYNYDAEK